MKNRDGLKLVLVLSVVCGVNLFVVAWLFMQHALMNYAWPSVKRLPHILFNDEAMAALAEFMTPPLYYIFVFSEQHSLPEVTAPAVYRGHDGERVAQALAREVATYLSELELRRFEERLMRGPADRLFALQVSVAFVCLACCYGVHCWPAPNTEGELLAPASFRGACSEVDPTFVCQAQDFVSKPAVYAAKQILMAQVTL